MEKSSGRFWLPDWIVDYCLQKFGLAETRILLILARHANKAGVAWPAVKTMAALSGYSPRSVQRALRNLAGAGIIAKITKGDGGRGVWTKYRLFAQSWLEFKRAQDSGKGDNQVSGFPGGKGDNQTSGFTPGKGDSQASGFPEDRQDKGRQSGSERVTNDALKGDRALSTEGIKEGISKGAGLILTGGTIGKKVRWGHRTDQQLRQEADRQKAALQKIQKCH